MRHLVLACCVGAVAAQDFEVLPTWKHEVGSVALQQAVLDATTDQLALVLASHPDDRYVMPLAYLRFARGWRVAAAMATRGEGGQNSEGPETGDELGWKRTLETEACAAALDARVWYLNRRDGGYCKSAQEALELWGRDEMVRRLARAIRALRPDVLLTTHHPDEPHGHDLALLSIIPPAIELAADAAADIEELRGLQPFRVVKVFRGPGAGELSHVHDSLPMEDMDRARGDTYRRLAYAALKLHRSAEPIRPIDELFESVVRLYPMHEEPGAPAASCTLVDGLPSLFDSEYLERTDALRDLEARIHDLPSQLGSADELVRTAIDLRVRLGELRVPAGSDAEVRLRRRMDALERVVLHGSAFQVTAEVGAGAVATAGQGFPLRIRVQNAGGAIFRRLVFTASAGATLRVDPDQQAALVQVADEPFHVQAWYTASSEAANRPQWLRGLFGAEVFQAPVALNGRVTVADPVSGQPRFDIGFPVVVPTDLHAPVEFAVMPRAVLLQRDSEVQTIAVRVGRHAAARVEARLEVLGPPGFEIEGSPVAVQMDAVEHQDFQFELRVPERLKPGVYNLHVRFGEHRTVIPVHKIDVRVPGRLTVGLVPGVDDTAKSVLQGLLGNRLEVLEDEEITLADLSQFDTILIDIRALRKRPGSATWKTTRAAFPRLLEFVRRGGRLVVLYHKDTEFNADLAGFEGWPYPLRIGKGRVTREDAPVEVLAPNHVLLRYPNTIKPDDWDGWVQERGLYFPSEYASVYQEIIATADPGEENMRGAVLYAEHGEGEYVYCALSLYRQLDRLHPGACRIFANLVSPRTR